MVLSSLLTTLLAHGSDPTPLNWDEALADLVKFTVTFVLIGFMSYPVLAPLLHQDNDEGSVSETEAQKSADASEDSEPSATQGADDPPKSNRTIAGWLAVALLLVLSMFWWLARASLVEVITQEPSIKENHAHASEEGGQVAMWGDFHTEVARVESGEVRIYLRDSFSRSIAGEYFKAKILPITPGEKSEPSPTPAPKAMENPPDQDLSNYVDTELSLDGTYRFARLPREAKEYKVKITTPGWTSSFRFVFDGSKGRSSIWCSVPRQ